MDIGKFHSRVEALETLMQVKLGGRGKTLAARFRRAGRLLPKHVRNAGRVIVDAESMAKNPKLARLQDPQALNAAFADVTAYLKAIDPADRRRGKLMGVLGGMVFNLLLLIGAVLALLYWQGLI